MAATSDPVDRRAALKAKSRKAILDAAAGLMRARRSADFSVDDLAAAADVSRRTVFNHFASLEDIVTAVAGEMLADVLDHMEAQATSAEPETVLGDLVAIASGVHLVPTIAYLVAIFGLDEHDDTRRAVLMQRAFHLFTNRMSASIATRHPEAEPLAVELLTAAFCGGLLGLVDRWIAATGAEDSPESRRAWDDLLADLTAVLREPATREPGA
ncbi:TetR/AcrR family transcriptional regulator [Glycomyces sp. NPDC046736]|uniref:TetR/AcrR family transcriptional regulator n=1 Tax=Glycomyces sp. NPDC046736 TaxID=3155615 RepID=UPI0033CD7087